MKSYIEKEWLARAFDKNSHTEILLLYYKDEYKTQNLKLRFIQTTDQYKHTRLLNITNIKEQDYLNAQSIW